MSDAGFASLNPTLLARKGGAKPAMRPQLAPIPEDVEDDQLEDLGWNDMGGEELGADNENVVSLSPGVSSRKLKEAPSPIVKRQQKDLADRVLADAAMDGSEEPDEYGEEEAAEVAPVALPRAKRPSKSARNGAEKGRRAAFTLRLDTDRHLKLRLAATMQGVSAQVLVTQALDAMLDTFDDLDALAERMKRN